ncbi:hypothetical protein ACFXDH_52650, partial [Streptomyces sp. NPDC059467]|uniref:hypothetical protein n=1 Tax=Streptomyces sp. NPDC059467 TaxID=3346844 RepID=UPI0036B9ED5C
IWNKQRKEEHLYDVDDVTLGHRTRMTHNPAEHWVNAAKAVSIFLGVLLPKGGAGSRHLPEVPLVCLGWRASTLRLGVPSWG